MQQRVMHTSLTATISRAFDLAESVSSIDSLRASTTQGAWVCAEPMSQPLFNWGAVMGDGFIAGRTGDKKGQADAAYMARLATEWPEIRVAIQSLLDEPTKDTVLERGASALYEREAERHRFIGFVTSEDDAQPSELEPMEAHQGAWIGDAEACLRAAGMAHVLSKLTMSELSEIIFNAFTAHLKDQKMTLKIEGEMDDTWERARAAAAAICAPSNRPAVTEQVS